MTTDPKFGAIPSPRHALAAATPHVATALTPPNSIVVPSQLSIWGNDVHGDCVTAEEAFAKSCNNPEIFISEADVIAWATRHGVLEGATLVEVLDFMQSDGFSGPSATYDDGKYVSVDWSNSDTLQNAISQGPVKIGVAGEQLLNTWRANDGKSGWFATSYNVDKNENHCVSLCGYGTMSWLAEQLQVSVPSGVDGTRVGYALFTWDSIGIIDEPSMRAITYEAWLRTPTTVSVAHWPDWLQLDHNPATIAIVADGADLYQLHDTGKIFRYIGTPITGWEMLDQNPDTKMIAASGGNLYQLHNTGKIFRYTGTPITGWQLLDQNPATVSIVADGSNLNQLHDTGKIFRYTGTPITGWQMLDQNTATKQIAASGGNLYQLHNTGKIFRYTGTPITGWQMLDQNSASVSIVADAGRLYQLHNTGKIWRYTGTPMTGWQQLDQNPATKQIAAASGNLFQIHNTGAIWAYVGPPNTGWQQLDGNAASVSIAASGNSLYQLHSTGMIWRYTGPLNPVL
ncbi:hypothetical protein [Mycobacterium sp. UM_CSW]|uniref:hypothetical protein n=1 Tax=Mycobacterium sp. UM_CSW TaxID=1370119 RepID=UPI0012678A30|nr:hypothetical protein [Mycobacterium sp. UM_CSW]